MSRKEEKKLTYEELVNQQIESFGDAIGDMRSDPKYGKLFKEYFDSKTEEEALRHLSPRQGFKARVIYQEKKDHYNDYLTQLEAQMEGTSKFLKENKEDVTLRVPIGAYYDKQRSSVYLYGVEASPEDSSLLYYCHSKNGDVENRWKISSFDRDSFLHDMTVKRDDNYPNIFTRKIIDKFSDEGISLSKGVRNEYSKYIFVEKIHGKPFESSFDKKYAMIVKSFDNKMNKKERRVLDDMTSGKDDSAKEFGE